jgi:hypothetical protein
MRSSVRRKGARIAVGRDLPYLKGLWHVLQLSPVCYYCTAHRQIATLAVRLVDSPNFADPSPLFWRLSP